LAQVAMGLSAPGSEIGEFFESNSVVINLTGSAGETANFIVSCSDGVNLGVISSEVAAFVASLSANITFTELLNAAKDYFRHLTSVLAFAVDVSEKSVLLVNSNQHFSIGVVIGLIKSIHVYATTQISFAIETDRFFPYVYKSFEFNDVVLTFIFKKKQDFIEKDVDLTFKFDKIQRTFVMEKKKTFTM
jgi:hypothetical protein